MSDNTSRLDDFYLNEDHASNPKEYFKKAANIIEPLTTDGLTLVDVGCAGGDFLKYVHSIYPKLELFGVDAFESMVEETKKRVSSCQTFVGDLNKEKLELEKGPFDIVTMLGVISIFSNENWISNFFNLIKPGGTGLIFGMVNPYPYDVFVTLRNEEGENEFGWNSWSNKTLQDRFEGLGAEVETTWWNPPVDVPNRADDPLRSWSILTQDGDRMFVNGSRMVHDFAFVKITN